MTGLFTRKFFIYHAIALLLAMSFFLPWTSDFWAYIDTHVFLFMNSYAKNHHLQQIFWSLANIKITDIYGASILFGLFFLYILEARGSERKKRLAQLCFTLFWFEVGIFISKQVITATMEAHHWGRHSPTIFLTDSFMLSTVVPWCKIKDSSYFCFPADHAIIAIQWSLFLLLFAGRRYGITAFCITIFLLLPRIISGAHWLTDIVLGSASYVLIIFAWATETSVFKSLLNLIYRLFRVLPKEELTDGQKSIS